MPNDTNHEDDDQHSDDVEPDATDSDQKSGIPRRNFLAAGAATAAGAAVVASGISGPSAFAQAAGKAGRAGNFTNPREDPSGGRGHGRPGQPNFLFIMVDEMRYPVPYESAQLKAWRLQYLKTQNTLMRHGVTLRKHSVASCACVPSRASVFTGQYPSLHGAVATDGGGKQGVENDMFWLAPNTLPTMGNYFRQAGYRTFYKGKWHVSEASLFAPGTHDAPLWSFDESGVPVPALEQLYLNANALDPYGFDGWVGPEPHPTNASNAGRLSASSAATGLSGRDEAYADQVVRQIQAFDSDRSDNRPWLLVSSFVDPHDIALVGLLAWTGAWLADRGLGQNCGPISPLAFENDLAGVPTADQLFNPAMFARTFNDNLALKPTCQASNQQAYRTYMSGIPDLPRYMRYYYTLQQRVDNQMFKVYSALKASRFYENTIVIFTSDHGDYLSSHGNQHQKWYSAYEEIVNVPCVISNPKMFPHPKTVDAATNHVDLIPTMLGLAGLDPEPLRQALSASFTDAQRLIGRNLTPLVTGAVSSSSVKDPVYFMTDDDMSRGSNQFNWIGYPYNSVVQPNHIETVLVWMDGAYWKYSRYFDVPQFWSSPGYPAQGCGTDSVVASASANKPAGTYTVAVTQTVKRQPVPDQFEMYNVTADPMELNNLAGNPRYRKQQKALGDLLVAESCAKRLQPNYSSGIPGSTETIPGAPVCA